MVGSPFLKIGVITECFQQDGKHPLEKDLLKIKDNGSAISECRECQNIPG